MGQQVANTQVEAMLIRTQTPGLRAIGSRRSSQALLTAILFAGLLVGCSDETDSTQDAGAQDTGTPIQFGDGSTADIAANDVADTTTDIDQDSGEATDAAGDEDADAATTDAGALDGDGTTDGSSSPIIALKLTLPATLELSGSSAVALSAKDSQGATFDAAANPELVLKINGQVQPIGFDLAGGSTAVQPIAVWKDKAGALRLVGVRPGKASIVAEIGAATSPPTEIEVVWPQGSGIWAAVPDAAGKTDAEQILDVPEATKIAGSTIGGGGLDASVRFASSSPGGSVLELGKAPTLAEWALTAAVAARRLWARVRQRQSPI